MNDSASELGRNAPATPIETAWEAGREAHGLSLSLEDFARAAEGSDLRHSVDLFLVLGCDLGLLGAWDRFLALYRDRLVAFARRWTNDPDQAEELVQSMIVHLREPPVDGSARTRLSRYAGTASLLTWLTVILRRRAVAERSRRREHSLDSRDEGEVRSGPAIPAAVAPPESVVLDRESTQRIRSALATAFERLTSREALVVVARFRDGLAQKDVAKLLCVGEPRISRLLQSAIGKLRQSIDRSGAEWGDAHRGCESWARMCQAAAESLSGWKEDRT